MRFKWKEHNISLAEVEAHMKSEYPMPEGKDAQSLTDADGLVFLGMSANQNGVNLHFSKSPEGRSKDEEGNEVIAEGSEYAAIKNYWDGLDENSTAAQNYFSYDAYKVAELAARSDAATKDWNNLSTQQKKLIANSEISNADMLQIVTDFGA